MRIPQREGYGNLFENFFCQYKKAIKQFFKISIYLTFRFLIYEALELQQAKAYAKKPRPGRAVKPYFNKDPPATTTRPSKRQRTEAEEPGQRKQQEPAGQNTGTGT